MEYTVSVRLMTYMHAPFIREAMDGIMKQKTDFFVEVVVGDDFSKDDTLKIIREYSNTEKIHIKILERNIGDEYWIKRQKLGRLYNFVNIIENCSGKYIALLDGDDYWTDPFKLQKQVDFLKSNFDYFLVCSSSNVLINNELKTNQCSEFVLEFDQFLETNYLGQSTCTALFRNIIDETFCDKLCHAKYGDWMLWLYCLSKGKGFFLEDVMACYRVHQGGMWGALTKEEKILGFIEMYESIENAFSVDPKIILDNKIKILKKYADSVSQEILLEYKKKEKIFNCDLMSKAFKKTIKKLIKINS